MLNVNNRKIFRQRRANNWNDRFPREGVAGEAAVFSELRGQDLGADPRQGRLESAGKIQEGGDGKCMFRSDSGRPSGKVRLVHAEEGAAYVDIVRLRQGDLQKEGLGLKPEVLADLIENCSVIINCAASIDFNARLDQAIDSNIRGSLRMLELARQIKNLSVFTHISTCYVNCDQRGLIK